MLCKLTALLSLSLVTSQKGIFLPSSASVQQGQGAAAFIMQESMYINFNLIQLGLLWMLMPKRYSFLTN